MNRILTLLLLLLMLFSTIHVVTAGEDDEESSDDDDETSKTESEDEDNEDEEDEDDEEERERAYEREVEFGTKGDFEFEFHSKSKNGEIKDEIEIKFDVNDGEPEIKIEYKGETETTEVKEKFRVELHSIIEYIDNGTVGNGYQDGIDDIVGDEDKYRLQDIDWVPLVYEESDVAGDMLFTITATSTDGIITLVLRLASGLIDVNANQTLTPDALKFDVEIHDFVYESNSSSLALVSKIKTESEREIDDETEHEVEGFSQEEAEVAVGNAAFFSWAETAEADGETVDVIASELIDSDDEEDDLEDGEHSSKMYFAFIATTPQDIVWDPKVGVISESTQELLNNIGQALNDAGLPGFPFWQALLLLGLCVPLVKRRKK